MKNNSLGFSLIELSIVLIIIGLLISGIVGGASLIESAKMRSFISEIKNWKQAVNSFYASKGRLPSDANDDGKIGAGANEGQLDHYFPAPYNGSEYWVWNSFSGPFVDLYINKITDFKPTMSRGSRNIYNIYAEKGLPESTALKNDNFWYFGYAPKIKNETSLISGTNISDITSNILVLNAHKKSIKCSFVKKLETKIDDNIIDTGSMRASCRNRTYDTCDKNTTCMDLMFKLDLEDF